MSGNIITWFSCCWSVLSSSYELWRWCNFLLRIFILILSGIQWWFPSNTQKPRATRNNPWCFSPALFKPQSHTSFNGFLRERFGNTPRGVSDSVSLPFSNSCTLPLVTFLFIVFDEVGLLMLMYSYVPLISYLFKDVGKINVPLDYT